MTTETPNPPNPWRLDRVETRMTHATSSRYVAMLEVQHETRGRLTGLARGEGPVQAAFHAMRELTGQDADLARLSVASDLSADADAGTYAAEVHLRHARGEHVARTRGTDAFEATVQAMLDGLAGLERMERVS